MHDAGISSGFAAIATAVFVNSLKCLELVMRGHARTEHFARCIQDR
jgi:hypothetical protein